MEEKSRVSQSETLNAKKTQVVINNQEEVIVTVIKTKETGALIVITQKEAVPFWGNEKDNQLEEIVSQI